MDFVYLELSKALARERVQRAQHRPSGRPERVTRSGRRVSLGRRARRAAVAA